MARVTNKLTDTAAKSSSLKPAGAPTRGGLYLNVSPSGSKSWLFMWTASGKRREMGLGAYPLVGLAKAWKLAAECRNAVANGRDPIAEKRAEAPTEPTFAECVKQFLASMSNSWRNEKHRAQWRRTLTDYCEAICSKRVTEIGTAEVLEVLTPIWTEKPETASRLRGEDRACLGLRKG